MCDILDGTQILCVFFRSFGTLSKFIFNQKGAGLLDSLTVDMFDLTYRHDPN